MTVKTEINFNELLKLCWSGAIDTLHTVEEEGKELELMALLEEIFIEPTLTEVNDFLWFDADTVFESLGIKDDEEDY